MTDKQTCETCFGLGFVLAEHNAQRPDPDTFTSSACPTCHGTGKQTKEAKRWQVNMGR